MKVAFFVPLSSILPFSWEDFYNGKIGLSGTHAGSLRLISKLAQFRDDLDLYFFTDCNIDEIDGVRVYRTDTLNEAVAYASAMGVQILVYNHNEKNGIIDALKDAASRKLKIIVWGRNPPSREFLSAYANIDSVKCFICVSQNEADHLRHLPVYKKTAVIYNPIDFDFYKLNEVKKNLNQVCFLGAITENKGIHILLKVWPEIHKRNPSAKLKIIGSAKLYSRDAQLGPVGLGSYAFEKKFVEPVYGVDPKVLEKYNITLLGLLTPERVKEVLAESLIGISNPNYNYKMSVETYCYSAVETQACGTAVIGGNVGGLRNTVLHKKTGLLIRSEKDLVHNVLFLLSNTDTAVKFGQRGREYVRGFDINNIVGSWLELLKKVFVGEPMVQNRLSIRNAEIRVLAKELIRRIKY